MPQRQTDADQPLLRPVVQITLEPAALGVTGGDDAGARCLDFGQLVADFGLQPRDLDRQSGAVEHLVDQLGRVAGSGWRPVAR